MVGICRSLANELAGHHIRVNTVHPAGVDPPWSPAWRPSSRSSAEALNGGAIFTNALPVEALDPPDVSNAVLWLASEEARFVTGTALTVQPVTPSADQPFSAEFPVQTRVPGARP